MFGVGPAYLFLLQQRLPVGLMEALQTATINPVRFLGKSSDFGSVERGRIADLLILRANPLENIANTRAIAGVVADGRYWSQAEIERLREHLKREAAAR